MARYSRGRHGRGKTPFKASGALGKTREHMRILRESQIEGLVETHQTIEKIAKQLRQAMNDSHPTSRTQALAIEKQLIEKAARGILELGKEQPNRTKRQFVADCLAYFSRVSYLAPETVLAAFKRVSKQKR